MDGAGSSPTVRLQLLKAELEKAQESRAAVAEFDAVLKELPNGLRDLDGRLRIRPAGARMNEAIRIHLQALDRYEEFVSRNSIKDNSDD